MSKTTVSVSDSPVQSAGVRRSRTCSISSEPSILSKSYLDCHISKNDLIRRLRKVVDALSQDDVDVDSPNYPDLSLLAEVLKEDRYLCHRDRDVRLLCVLACMELFYLYAPSPPWSEVDILKIFSQTIRHLATVTVCTNSSQPNFAQYLRLLERLATVKIGIVLVEMTRTLEFSSASDARAPEVLSSDAMEILCELIRTILTSITIEHPSEFSTHAVTAISACIDEFDVSVPIPILDELLVCISAGPVIFVTNPAFVEEAAILTAAKKNGKGDINTKLPPAQIQQTNQSYMLAAAVIRRTEDRISNPIAYLLNGLLNSDSSIVQQSNISSSEGTPSVNTEPPSSSSQLPADVWTIIYELHRIAPHILTTVIGTVAASLQASDSQKRLRVTKLLGRLFTSSASNIATQFYPCYKDWLRRCSDVEQTIRLAMVKSLTNILSTKSGESALCREATDALENILRMDPSLDVRLLCIRELCDIAYRQKCTDGTAFSLTTIDNDDKIKTLRSTPTGPLSVLISARLLKAVGTRVCSKVKLERRDAITGLSQIYYRHYVLEKLKWVQCGGEDCEIGVVLDVIHDTCSEYCLLMRKKVPKRSLITEQDKEFFDLDEKYKFIPRLVFESACFTDSTDHEMRSRIIHIIDDVLLGYPVVDCKRESKLPSLSSTSRAVGLAMIVHSLQGASHEVDCTLEQSNAFKWLLHLLTQRAKLQHCLNSYIDARAHVRQFPPGSDEALAADATAFEKLRLVATMYSPVSQSPSVSTLSSQEVTSLLKSFHVARDKHIFKLLASIASPLHSSSARSRALDDLPKRTQALGSCTVVWVKELTRRCAMGGFLNIDVVKHCVQLAKESLDKQDVDVALIFLRCVQIALKVFPAIGGSDDCFRSIIEMFRNCVKFHSGDFKRNIDESGILTVASGILAIASQAYSQSQKLTEKERTVGKLPTCNIFSLDTNPDLRSHLLRLCTKNGSPEQARNAIISLVSLENRPKEIPGSESTVATTHDTSFHSILQEVSSPSQMKLSIGGKANEKLVTVLSALTALVEAVPSTFCATDAPMNRGYIVVQYVLEVVVLGIDSNVDCKHALSSDDQQTCVMLESSQSSVSHESKNAGSNISPRARSGSTHERSSLICRRLCAAIDFLVAHIRSTILVANTVKSKRLNSVSTSRFSSTTSETPSASHIALVFNTLTNIIKDGGMPPSARDRREFNDVKERAALRQCAAINILRLCDGRLQIEAEYLSFHMWHVLSSVIVDEDLVVRAAIMDELSCMLLGSGHYSNRSIPSLRFLAFAIFLMDSEQGGEGDSKLGGSSAKVSRCPKVVIERCILSLRKKCDVVSLQFRSKSPEAEHYFDTNLKMDLMPEYAFPYALYLLSFSKETPTATSIGLESGKRFTAADSAAHSDVTRQEDTRQKLLRKRLKCLIEPLVRTLGEGANNISLLLRMTELIGRRYRPEEISDQNPRSDISLIIPLKINDQCDPASEPKESYSKLSIVCLAARDILMKCIKRDVSLKPYPGAIHVPKALFSRIKHDSGFDEEIVSAQPFPPSSSSKRVHFSPEILGGVSRDKIKKSGSKFISNGDADIATGSPMINVGNQNWTHFDSTLSPIPQSTSPMASPQATHYSSPENDVGLHVRSQVNDTASTASPSLETQSEKENKSSQVCHVSSVDRTCSMKKRIFSDVDEIKMKRRKSNKLSPVSISIGSKESQDTKNSMKLCKPQKNSKSIKIDEFDFDNCNLNGKVKVLRNVSASKVTKKR